MSFQYFSGEVRGLRGPGLTADQQEQVDAAVALIPAALLKEGDAVGGTGFVDTNQSQIKNIRAGAAPFDAVRMDQPLLKVGGQMAGPLDMGQEALQNLVAGAAPFDAVRMDQIAPFNTVALQARSGTQLTWQLRNLSQDIMALRLGQAVQIRKALFGDSWTDGLPYFSDVYLRRMKAEFAAFGDGAGAGYVGFAWDAVSADNTQAHKNIDINVLVAYSGSITSAYKGSYTPDLGFVTLGAIGDKITVTLPATDNSNAATLWSPGSSGDVRYRWKGGAWTAVNLSTAGLIIAAVAGITTGGGVLEIEATSANAKVGGVRFTGIGAGVRIEKFGVSGATIADYLAANEAQWVAGLDEIDPRVVQLMFFTNDRNSVTPAQFGANYAALIARIRIAIPYADIEIVMPPENAIGGDYPQSEYADAAYDVAVAQGCAFIDLQNYFGADPDAYDWASPQKLLDASGAHPTQQAGGYRIVGSVMRMELGHP